MPQRQRPADFHLAKRKAGVQVFHIRLVDQHVTRELAEAVQVAAQFAAYKRWLAGWLAWQASKQARPRPLKRRWDVLLADAVQELLKRICLEFEGETG